MNDLYDVTIIGGGPAGLYTAFYSGMRSLKTKLIEAKPDLGGVVTHFYPEKCIYDVGGIVKIRGEELIEQLTQQAKTFQPKIVKNQVIDRLKVQEDGLFQLTSTNGDVHVTRKIILAVGCGTFEVNKLQLDGAERFENTSLFYAVHQIRQFSGKRVVISGGGDAALDWAAELSQVCRQVTVVYRGDSFTHALEHQVRRLRKHSVNVKLNSELIDLSGSDKLQSVTIRETKTSQTKVIPADALIVNHGFRFGLGGIENWGLSIENNGIVVDQRMESSVKGIFAIGNAASYPNKFYLIAVGFVEGAAAVNAIKHDLDPEAPSQATVSTHHEKFVQKD
ncbi:NAD(P)/FAD-dependent oxidoreductase [Sporolactobacillus sp. Y61]|uniref:Ferredoxin--NADP reductase n=1 Tax=Sporolactobacillus sp. Y61 TaxID=3160863 RepID=A0AAU8IIT8_9BACL